ncbi:Uncharacterised protein [Raoultella ornithinolytica]|nr:Uncharacterised protein [Raoultella ornithinolytica]
MPADTGVDEGRACRLDGLRQLNHFRQRTAVVDQVEHRQAVDNNKIVASPFAYRTHDFYGKAHAPGVIAAPLVVTLVGARGEEFVD